jgi:hypothetical protein
VGIKIEENAFLSKDFDKWPEVQCPKGEFHSHPFSSYALKILIKRMREDCLSHRA